ncbi:MAG: methyltransferase domain-containing protein [candidate division FCPU426 bacterium]
MDKTLIQTRFRRALDHYDQHAGVQADAAKRLVDLVLSRLGAEFPRVLEVGCGTGLLTRRLIASLRMQTLYANDLVPECGQRLPAVQTPRLVFLPGDAEAAAEWPPELDLAVSNAAFQWLQNPAALLASLAAALRPGAGLAFAVFGPGHCRELRDTLGVGLDYLGPAQWQELAGRDFEFLFAEEEERALVFTGPREVLRHLRGLGATGLAGWRWRKESLRAWETEYRRAHAAPGGVRLSQRILYLVFKKRGGLAA